MTTASDTTKFAREFLDFVNGMTRDEAEAFAEEIMRGHRTLQQSTFGLFTLLVKHWAEARDTGRYDLRNEYTVERSEKIWKEILGQLSGAPLI